MTITNHVAPPADKLRANSRTRFAASVSELQFFPGISKGLLPSSWARGRWNHRRYSRPQDGAPQSSFVDGI